MTLSAEGLDFKELNERIRSQPGDVCIEACCGQRFIGSGFKEKTVTICGTPGNALGAYLDGATIEVRGNVQDAVGDTMNGGQIIVHGSAGDALGYAMRGGRILVRGNAGYRTGIHMKEYAPADGPLKRPVIVVGGQVGSFLGEYLAGGIIVVLGIGCSGVPVGNFTGTGMHGGRIFIRTDTAPAGLPEQVAAAVAGEEDLRDILPELHAFAAHFKLDVDPLVKGRYYVLKPNAKNPYQQLYTAN